MGASDILARVKAAQHRLRVLQQQVPSQPPEMLAETLAAVLEEFNVALAELEAGEEELLQQNGELAAERQRDQDLFEFAPEGYLVTDVQGVIQEANRAAAKLLGRSREYLTGKPLIVFVAEPERQAFHSHLSRMLQVSAPHGVHEWILRLQPTRDVAFDAALTVAAVGDREDNTRTLRWVLRDITEQRRAQQELHLKERKLTALFEAAPDPILVVNRDGGIERINKQVEIMFGYRSEELLGQPVEMLMPPRFRERHVRHRAAYARQLQTRPMGVGLELCARRKDGSEFPVDIMLSPLDASEDTAVIAIVRDITGIRQAQEALRKAHDDLERQVQKRTKALLQTNAALQAEVAERTRTEAALRESETRFRVLVDSAPVLIWVNGLEGCEFVNRAYREFLGVPNTADVERYDWAQFIHPDDRDAYVGAYRDCFARRAPFAAQCRFRRHDGVYRWMTSVGQPRFTAAGEFLGYVGSTLDISDLKEAVASLRESEARFRRLTESNIIGVVIGDLHGRILEANDIFLHMVGYTQEALLAGRVRWDEMTPPEHRHLSLRAVRQLKESAVSIPWEQEYIRCDGRRVPVLIGATLTEGSPDKFIAFLLDLTVARRAEEERERLLQRLVTAQEEERNRIARELHDQMAQHLAGLKLELMALRDHDDCPPEAQERILRLQDYVAQLAQQVRHLAWELRPPALKERGLLAAARSYLEEWSQSARIEVDFHGRGFESPGTLPPHLETTIYRIVQEALTNVLKHARAHSVSVLLERRSDHVLAIIEDDGQGFASQTGAECSPISSQNSSPEKGGLGLLGMQERAALFGGTIVIESTSGQGTAVFLRIPLESTGGGGKGGD